MLRVFAVATFAGLASPAAAEPPAIKTITRADRQNFVLSRPGDLRIVGDPNRYDIELPAGMLFDFDKAKLRREAEPLLGQLKAHFAAKRTSQLLVWGHTDSKGSDSHNFTLSQKRAKAVCDWMRTEVGPASRAASAAASRSLSRRTKIPTAPTTPSIVSSTAA